ncbi:UDP-N-acetylglucosamine--undecaprenyl-phosphate N-acetylglucosaminephosphotransferase [Vibrio mediterranei]|uniref:UDP-N-acetylglucosamine--undecaprenyl-phosphate N-acetylglucosaminephosphotransferase n=1 Tax=Vibrio mediterranei TaxID=689 RepID=UPI002283F186|nr:UDP-N-acetylglucosamine--undecaprenyl-phosphate N-acetylglucosaminephosphotransferase [Vibrio mediterranei]MCY9853658.1 UDP-N-acetylglucosamine--undecaprenyl-phosphate N-acetylglucosaminephosphotransferase [Vibrio mediterranei]
MLYLLTFTFFSAFIVLSFCRTMAPKLGLMDKPNARKHHQGAVPLVGGIAICTTVILSVALFQLPIKHQSLFLTSIGTLTLLGAFDDKFDICFKARLVIQTLLSVAMMYFGGLELSTLGNLFGLGDVELGGFAYVITVLAVIGAINAFNMVDGIDGLLGGLSVVTFGALAWLMSSNNHHTLSDICLLFISAVLPYILMNLGLIGRRRRVFMGDAGSMMIGFTVIWLLLSASQDASEPLIRPITALWLIALPLMDMAAIMIRRIRRGHSPFKPDREHLHHICQRLGLSSRQTLLAICSLATLLTGFGIVGEVQQLPESFMFISFIICFVVYTFCLSNIWKVTSFLRRKLSKNAALTFQKK